MIGLLLFWQDGKVGEKMKLGDQWRALSFGGYGNVEMMFTSQVACVIM